MFRAISSFPNWTEIKATLSDIALKKFTTAELVNKIVLFKTYSHMARQKDGEKPLSGEFPILTAQYKK
jgi:hypothetical protein